MTDEQWIASIKSAKDEAAKRDAARMAEHEVTDTLVNGRKHFRMAHKVTGLSYQAMDIEAGMRSEVV